VSALTGLTPPAQELEAMAAALRAVSGDLLESYERLSVRARRMEQELCETNAELQRKVRELDLTRERLEAILDALPCGVAVRDGAGRIVRVNRALGRILGRAPEELLERSALPGLERGHDEVCEVHRADGEIRMLLARRSEVTGAGGEHAGSVEIIDDRTELERLAERLHRVDKMAALGTMAGGLAHEIRNPMNAIGGFAELLLRSWPSADEARGGQRPAQHRRWLEAILEGAREVESIIAGLLSLADPGRLCVERLATAPLLEEAVALALRGVPRPDRWSVRQVCDVPHLMGDHVQLRQALRNLVANALLVQPEGGQVLVHARGERAEVVLEVEDAGPGIPAEHFRRAADPFFTTRAEGTGLGLSLVHAIAQLHGGALEIDRRRSALGGARVRIRVPLLPLEVPTPPRAGRAAAR
jgi:signal transduction histidine kinase